VKSVTSVVNNEPSMTDALPQGWTSICLAELVSARKGKKPGATKPGPSRGFVPYLDIRAIERDEISSYAEAASSRLGSIDDIFVVWDGARSGWVGLGREGAIGSTIMALMPVAGNRSYIYRWLQSQFEQINTNTRGTGIPHVDPDVFWNLEVPFAPLAEQRRIVAKLETVLGKVDACQQRLAKIPVLLKRFRQAVLAAACSGELTEDWRGERTTDSTEDTDNEASVQSVVSEWASEGMPELPKTWSWGALGEYGRCFRGRFTPRPSNDPRYFGGKHPFIQIGDLPREGGLVTCHTQTLNDEGLVVSRNFPKGTVVIAIVGATIGNTGVLAYDMCVTDSIVGIDTGTPEGNRYVEFCLRHKKHEIRQASYASGGQPNINLEFLNPYPLPLPPSPNNRKSCGGWRRCLLWRTESRRGFRRPRRRWISSRPRSSPKPSADNSCPKTRTTSRRRDYCSALELECMHACWYVQCRGRLQVAFEVRPPRDEGQNGG